MTTITKPSVQSLFIQMRFDGQPISTGTGFLVHAPSGSVHLITNRHNVTGRRQDNDQPLSPTGGIPNELVVLQNQLGKLGSWTPKIEALYEEETPRWREHPTLGKQADFVALPLSDVSDVEVFAYDPANPGQAILVGPADPVSVIGFPFGIAAGGAFAVWATGFVASEPAVDFNDLPIQLIDCRTRPGQSGSPVLAYRAGGAVAMESGGTSMFGGPVERFIGIYSGRINAESDLGIVWKAAAIAELVAVL